MNTLIPKRATARDILRTLLLQKDTSGKTVALFPKIKDIPGLIQATDIAHFPSRFSKCYAAGGTQDAELHKRLVSGVIAYAETLNLLPGIDAAGIGEALETAYQRVGLPQVRVDADLLERTDINDHHRWKRVVLISSSMAPVMDARIVNALFRNLSEAGRGFTTVDIRVYLPSASMASAYKDAVVARIWGEMQTLAPSTEKKEVEALFDRVMGGGSLRIDADEETLRHMDFGFAVAVLMGEEGVFVTNLTPKRLPEDDAAMDLWERIAGQLRTLEPLAVAHGGGGKRDRSTERAPRIEKDELVEA